MFKDDAKNVKTVSRMLEGERSAADYETLTNMLRSIPPHLGQLRPYEDFVAKVRDLVVEAHIAAVAKCLTNELAAFADLLVSGRWLSDAKLMFEATKTSENVDFTDMIQICEKDLSHKLALLPDTEPRVTAAVHQVPYITACLTPRLMSIAAILLQWVDDTANTTAKSLSAKLTKACHDLETVSNFASCVPTSDTSADMVNKLVRNLANLSKGHCQRLRLASCISAQSACQRS